MKPRITIYQRDRCHLCEVAAALLEQIQADFQFELERVDIESDEQLHARYLERIPVICLDGAELYDFEIDLPDLKSRLSEASAR
jgi:glutaredoxin